MKLALGDTANPFEFAIRGVTSPFGTASQTLLRLAQGASTLAEVAKEIDDMLEDCDAGHTQAQIRFQGNETAHTLAVQWALIAQGLLRIIAEIHTKAALPREQQTRNDFGQAAVVHDLLVTRCATFIKNGVLPI